MFQVSLIEFMIHQDTGRHEADSLTTMGNWVCNERGRRATDNQSCTIHSAMIPHVMSHCRFRARRPAESPERKDTALHSRVRAWSLDSRETSGVARDSHGGAPLTASARLGALGPLGSGESRRRRSLTTRILLSLPTPGVAGVAPLETWTVVPAADHLGFGPALENAAPG